MADMTQLSANVSDSTHVSKISIGVFKSLPMFQKKANEVSFVFKHGVSQYASIIIDICAAHLSNEIMKLYNYIKYKIYK